MCINRNIVECKEKRERKVENAGYGINRNIVECKVVTLLSIFYHRSVLIETLWNVKSEKVSKFLRFALGINRNIVECKVIFSQRYNWKAKPY